MGNYPEVIVQGQNGYVFDYASPTEAVEILDKLISVSAEWKQKARECSLQIASKYYDPQKVVKRLVDDLVRENS